METVEIVAKLRCLFECTACSRCRLDRKTCGYDDFRESRGPLVSCACAIIEAQDEKIRRLEKELAETKKQME